MSAKRAGTAPELVIATYDATGNYQVWTEAHGLRGAAAAVDADPDFDQINNLLEYGLGGVPTNGTPEGILPTFGDGLEYVYRRRADADLHGLEYRLVATTNLISGSWTTNGISVVGVAGIDSAFESVTNTVTADDPQKFLHLQVKLH